MWIRSQNRMQLQDANHFVIEQFEIGIYIVGNGCTLGIYSTKEKALEVLDKIQKYIGCERFYSTTKGISEQQAISSECTKVFQMPQDDEVEV